MKIYFINKYKRYILLMMFLGFFLVRNVSFADNISVQCSQNGYTILTINGILTSDEDAKKNKAKLASYLGPEFNNEPLTVDYILNPSHGTGVFDLTDTLIQGDFNEQDDYDLTEILIDASGKIKTQKVLGVPHSQGNFYANSFYNKVVNKDKNIPSKSIGIYALATPASYVAGISNPDISNYMTSDNDVVVNKIAGYFFFFSNRVLPHNVDIKVSSNDFLGHSFSKIYLEYQAPEIVRRIYIALSRLESNDIQPENMPCIKAPEISVLHQTQTDMLVVLDHPVSSTKDSAVYIGVGTYNGLSALGNGVLMGVSVAATTTYNGLSFLGNGVLNGITNAASVISSLAKSLAKNNTDLGNNSAAAVVLSNTPEENNSDKPAPAEKKEVAAKTNKSKENVPTPQVDKSTAETTEETSPTTEATPPYVPPSEKPVVEEPVVTLFQTKGNDNPGSPTYRDPSFNTPNPIPPPSPPPPPPTPPTPPPPPPDTTPPVITVIGTNPARVSKNSTYTDLGATAIDAVDGAVSVVTTGAVDTSTLGTYTLTYTATDSNGNTSTATRDVQVSTYVYIPRFTFGTGNGDGNDWQAWHFNSSYVYDWSDTYVSNYLRESFKFQNILGFGCPGAWLQRGIFNHDPQLGYEPGEIAKSFLENSPQCNGGNHLYSVIIQWDAAGYAFTIFDETDNIFYSTDTIRTDIPNVNADMWIGWNSGSSGDSNFQFFPSGEWLGNVHSSGLTGGRLMMLTPYPVYVP